MTRLVAFKPTTAVLGITTGVTVATGTGVPLLTPLTLTDAVKLPAIKPVSPVTVSVVLVALVTVPVAPPLNVTVSLAAVPEKPEPLMVKVVALAGSPVELAVTAGGASIVWLTVVDWLVAKFESPP